MQCLHDFFYQDAENEDGLQTLFNATNSLPDNDPLNQVSQNHAVNYIPQLDSVQASSETDALTSSSEIDALLSNAHMYLPPPPKNTPVSQTSSVLPGNPDAIPNIAFFNMWMEIEQDLIKQLQTRLQRTDIPHELLREAKENAFYAANLAQVAKPKRRRKF